MTGRQRALVGLVLAALQAAVWITLLVLLLAGCGPQNHHRSPTVPGHPGTLAPPNPKEKP